MADVGAARGARRRRCDRQSALDAVVPARRRVRGHAERRAAQAARAGRFRGGAAQPRRGAAPDPARGRPSRRRAPPRAGVGPRRVVRDRGDAHLRFPAQRGRLPRAPPRALPGHRRAAARLLFPRQGRRPGRDPRRAQRRRGLDLEPGAVRVGPALRGGVGALAAPGRGDPRGVDGREGAGEARALAAQRDHHRARRAAAERQGAAAKRPRRRRAASRCRPPRRGSPRSTSAT